MAASKISVLHPGRSDGLDLYRFRKETKYNEQRELATSIIDHFGVPPRRYEEQEKSLAKKKETGNLSTTIDADDHPTSIEDCYRVLRGPLLVPGFL